MNQYDEYDEYFEIIIEIFLKLYQDKNAKTDTRKSILLSKVLTNEIRTA